MIEPLTPNSVLDRLHRVLEESSAGQLPNGPFAGGFVSPEHGVDEPGMTAAMVAAAVHAYLLACGLGRRPPRKIAACAQAGAEYLLRVQRPSGRIDLKVTNYDSGPDTAFAVGRLCLAMESLRSAKLSGDDEFARRVSGAMETFIRRAVPGIAARGFHTANHRWVIASALAHATSLLGDLGVRSLIESYLVEGPDVDAEGAWIERSAGVYDAICDSSMLVLNHAWGRPEALAAARANLRFNLHLLNADGTIETELSQRQDHGKRVVPVALMPCYLWSDALEHDEQFRSAAELLWRQDKRTATSLSELAYVLLRFGQPALPRGAAPSDCRRYFPLAGLWRIRQGAFTASVFRGRRTVLAVPCGQGAMSLSIHTSYGGERGRFIPDTMEVDDDVAALRQSPPRLADFMPLGRPVPHDQWDTMVPQRQTIERPSAGGVLEVRAVAGGLDLRYALPGPFDGMLTQIAMDFEPGGQWEADGAAGTPKAGDTIFMTSRRGVMRYGESRVELTGGANAHRYVNMRGAAQAPHHVRVVVPLVTPVDHRLEIRVFAEQSPQPSR